MAISSYQQENDYNLVKEIRPFNLPYESYMQEIATKQQYWKVGADRMKSVYDQAVGLDPQFAQNKGYLKNFMDEAGKKLTKLSKSDLSVLDNSQQAVSIFKPLYDTTNKFNYRLLADSQINKHYQQQGQLSDTYRTKDGGKEWNQDNDFYFRDAQQKYLNDAKTGNLESIDGHFQNKKSYIPYYEGRQEVLDIQDACRGASFQNKQPSKSEMYFEETSKKGCTPEELSLALKTQLSPRYKQQAQISGYAYFKGQEDELAKKFTDIYVTKKQNLIEEIETKLKALKSGQISKENQQEIDSYESALPQLKKSYNESKLEYDDMVKGNVLDYVKNNYDRLAGQVYFGDLTDKLAIAYRTDDTKTLVNPNSVGLLKLKLETDRTNMFLQEGIDARADFRQHGYKMQEIGQQGQNAINLAIAKGEIENPSSQGQNATPVDHDGKHPNTITKEDFIESDLKPAKVKADETSKVLVERVKKALGKDNVGAKQIDDYTKIIKDKIESGQIVDEKDKDVYEAYVDYKEAINNLSIANNKIEGVKADIKTNHKDLFNDNGLSDKKIEGFPLYTMIEGKDLFHTYDDKPSKVTDKAPPLSEKDLFRIFNGETVNGYSSGNVTKLIDANLSQEKGEEIISPNGEKMKVVKIQVPALFFNGKEINTNTNPELKRLVNGFNSKKRSNLNEISRLETEAFTNNWYQSSKFTTFEAGNFGKKADFDMRYGNKVKKYFGNIGELGDKNGYNIIFRDQTGEGAYIRIKNDKGEDIIPSSKGADATLATLKAGDVGSGVKKEHLGDGYAYYIPDFFSRYPGLPDNQTLQKINKVKDAVLDIEKSLHGNITLKDKTIVSSDDPSINRTINYTSKFGVDFTISVEKVLGKGNKYKATAYNSATKENVIIKQDSVEQLLAVLETSPGKK